MSGGIHRPYKWAIAGGIFIALLYLSTLVHADGLDSGTEPYERCALCHGLFGNTPRQRFPRLAAQNTAYLEQQIIAFMDRHRSNDGGQMASVVTEIERSDIPSIVGWFSSQSAPTPYPLADSKGQALLASHGCSGCHIEPLPLGSRVPLLSSQHPDYLAKQLRDFRDGLRDPGDGRKGKLALAEMSDDDIQSIANHLASVERAK